MKLTPEKTPLEPSKPIEPFFDLPVTPSSIANFEAPQPGDATLRLWLMAAAPRMVALSPRFGRDGWASVIAFPFGLHWRTVMEWGRPHELDKRHHRPTVAILHAVLGLATVPDLPLNRLWRPEAARRGWDTKQLAAAFGVDTRTLGSWRSAPSASANQIAMAYAMATLFAGYPIPGVFHDWTA